MNGIKSENQSPRAKRRKQNFEKPLTDTVMLELLEDSECDDPDDDESFQADSSDNCESLCEEEFDDVKDTEEEFPDIIWNDDSSDMRKFIFKKQEKLLIPVIGENPIDYFMHILTDEFLEVVLNYTNHYASNHFLKEPSLSEWKDVTRTELLKFIGLLLHMGHIKMNRIQDYWKQNALYNLYVFSATMSRNRFLYILRALHFSNRVEPPPANGLYKVRSILDIFNQRMCDIYYPGRELTLDEGMVLCRGRLVFRHFIPNKKYKYKIKLYMLTDPKGLILKFAIYNGALGDIRGEKHAEQVVMQLLEGKLNTGHSIFIDNFYSSYSLAKKLLESQTHCTGILRLNAQHCPREVKVAKLKKDDVIGKYSHGVLIGKLKEQKEVYYISNEFKNEDVITTNRRNQLKLKPVPLVEYDKFMYSVNRQDQMLAYYNSDRKTLRWPVTIFVHILQMIMNNAHQLYNKYSGSHVPFYNFRISVVKELLELSAIERLPISSEVEHILAPRDVRNPDGKIKRKYCKLCHVKKKTRKDTIYVCKLCPNEPGYCLECSKIIHL